MKSKFLAYAAVPILGAGLLGFTGLASAHGLGMRMGLTSSLSPDDLAARHETMFKKQADLLGLPVADVKNAWSQGKSLPDLAKEKGISQAEVQKRLQAEHETQLKTQLKTLVDKGIITQAQADKRLQAMKDRATNAKGKKARHFMHGFGF